MTSDCDRLPMHVESGVVVSTHFSDEAGGGCFVTRIRAPEIARTARAGQFVMVRLVGCDFPYLGRPFSVADVDPEDPDVFAIAYTRVGEGTGMLADAVAGTAVRVVGNLGNGFAIAPAPMHVFVAGGIGSAPFPLLTRQIRAVDPDAPIRIYLGGRDASGLHLAAELAALGVDVRLATMDGSAPAGATVYRGTCVEHAASESLPEGARLYACGPNPMFAALASATAGNDLDVQASVEEHMACGFGACNACVIPVKNNPANRSAGWHYELICLRGPVFDIHRIEWHPEESEPLVDTAGSTR